MLLAVERGNRRVRFGVAGHLDEAKALAATGVAVIDDLRRHHLAVLAKQLFQLRAIDVIAQIPDVQLLTH
jgi:hypothetical protein